MKLRIHKSTIRLLIILIAVQSNLYAQKFEGLAPTPPMGWNTWNAFNRQVNEQLIFDAADAMVESGMKDAGYEYIVIDDCWQGGRDSLGFVYEDPVKFPSGMKALADYIHSKGLKFGVYSDAGAYTCAHYVGSRGHEYQDAIMYAKWGVDFLKYDWCNTDSLNAYWAYTTMRDALYSAGRPILFSMCEWGNNDPWKWGKNVGHMWRMSWDITHECFDCEVDYGGWSNFGPIQIAHQGHNIREYSGPDHWNDFDMLEVGNGLTVNEGRAHFSIWCMLAAPLIAGNDIRNMTPETKEILTNPDAIAIDQDPIGIQGFVYNTTDSVEVWAKPLVDDNWAICFFNRSSEIKEISFDWKENIIYDNVFFKTLDANKTTYKMLDLWTKKNLGSTNKKLSSEIPVHDVIMIKLIKQ